MKMKLSTLEAARHQFTFRWPWQRSEMRPIWLFGARWRRYSIHTHFRVTILGVSSEWWYYIPPRRTSEEEETTENE